MNTLKFLASFCHDYLIANTCTVVVSLKLRIRSFSSTSQGHKKRPWYSGSYFVAQKQRLPARLLGARRVRVGDEGYRRLARINEQSNCLVVKHPSRCEWRIQRRVLKQTFYDESDRR